jgi:hypothetical protein
VQARIRGAAFGCLVADALSLHVGATFQRPLRWPASADTRPRLQVCNQNTSLRVAPNFSRGIYPTKFLDGPTLPTQFGNDAGRAKK